MSDIQSLLHLLQLTNPALPIGAYAYSQGMEFAVEAGWVADEDSAADWILGQLEANLSHLDIPVFARLYTAWQTDDRGRIHYWGRWLLASRESSELLVEDRSLGRALARLLTDLDGEKCCNLLEDDCISFATVYALACVKRDICVETGAAGYLWSRVENQVMAAVKLIPLGQTAGQRLLAQAINVIPNSVSVGLGLGDDDMGAAAPGLGIASACHELQYTRLFRS